MLRPMKHLNLIIGLAVGLSMTGCPGDDGTAEETSATGTDTGTTMAPTSTTTPSDTTTDTPGTTTDADDTTTTDADDTTTTGETATTSGGEALSFEMDVYPIIMANCSCHIDGGPGMLSMGDAMEAYDNLVDVAAQNSNDGSDRVEPGDSAASFLYRKITGDLGGGEGDQMPDGGPPLDQADMDLIRDWIDEGANP